MYLAVMNCYTSMRVICACVLWLLLPAAALADGKMMSSTAFPANIVMPDQQALIHLEGVVAQASRLRVLAASRR
jgi:hypothetical protein